MIAGRFFGGGGGDWDGGGGRCLLTCFGWAIEVDGIVIFWRERMRWICLQIAMGKLVSRFAAGGEEGLPRTW